MIQSKILSNLYCFMSDCVTSYWRTCARKGGQSEGAAGWPSDLLDHGSLTQGSHWLSDYVCTTLHTGRFRCEDKELYGQFLDIVFSGAGSGEGV